MKIIALCSGGLDSTTLLYELLNQKNEVMALTCWYQQRHVKEIQKASETCKALDVPQLILTLPKWHENSVLSHTSGKVPHGHYADENMKRTVVANRNMIFLSIAIGVAVDQNYDAVAYACHAGDHTIYPDCRPIFVEKMQEIAAIANFKPILILTPYLYLDKTEIVKKGLQLGVNYKKTLTCYEGTYPPCMKCGSCTERIEAFKKNGVKDPLVTEKIWKTIL